MEIRPDGCFLGKVTLSGINQSEHSYPKQENMEIKSPTQDKNIPLVS